MGYFDWTFTLVISVGVGFLVGGSCVSQLLKVPLRSSSFFMDVVPSGGRILFFTDY